MLKRREDKSSTEVVPGLRSGTGSVEAFALLRDHEDVLVGVALQLGGVHAAAACGEGDEASGELGPHPVEHVGIAARHVAEVELGAADRESFLSSGVRFFLAC